MMVNVWESYACEGCEEEHYCYKEAEECEDMHETLLRKHQQDYLNTTEEISIDLEDAVEYIAQRMSSIGIDWIRDTLKYDWDGEQ